MSVEQHGPLAALIARRPLSSLLTACITTAIIASASTVYFQQPNNSASVAVLEPELEREATTEPKDVVGVTTINVAIYPYVPDPDYFKLLIQGAWSDPSTVLNFVNYDCYSSDPPSSVDVFAYDCIFLTHLAAQGYLRPIKLSEIKNSSDFLSYALPGTEYLGNYYGIPQLGCANILFYRSGDIGLPGVKTLKDLYGILGPATYTWPRPPKCAVTSPSSCQGFMMDFSGGTTCACLYVAAAQSYYDSYTIDPKLPSASNLDPAVMPNLWNMVKMAGPAQASRVDSTPYERGLWFGQDTARAMVGFTESMSQMGSTSNTVSFMPMPLGGTPSFNMFYVDAVGINSSVVGTSKETAAVELANLMTSSALLSKCFAGRANPQYLMPLRNSIFSTLASTLPQYGKMYSVVTTSNPKTLRLGLAARNWLKSNKDGIRQEILSLGGVPATTKEAVSTTSIKD